ncbi:BREX protein BrxB domain-containing protein [Nostoc sp. CHAB 5715]|uniref:BREX protein BrxB domain-containing protein n=1 Tax=Nostoc sp. CHAB 5715 TaxID=2780400 RepID=UPI0034D292C1
MLLLKNVGLVVIDGKTSNLPVVLLYPGERRDLNALSFMDELPSDRDYRPRIYS